MCLVVHTAGSILKLFIKIFGCIFPSKSDIKMLFKASLSGTLKDKKLFTFSCLPFNKKYII